MDTQKMEALAAYNVVSAQQRISLLNSRPKTLLFQNTATPTAIGGAESAIITTGDFPWILNQVQLGSISSSGNTLAASLYLQFNLYDVDNLGLFGGGVSPRASTVFGAPTQIPYAIQPVKVCPPRTRLKLEWTNQNPAATLGFELFLCGIEVLDMDLRIKDPDAEDIKDALTEFMEERRTR